MDENSPPSSESARGQGAAVLVDPHHVRADANMALRAMRYGWAKQRDRDELQMRAYLMNEHCFDRLDVSGFEKTARVILEADKLNIRQEQFDESAEQRRVELLGVIALLRDRSGVEANSGITNGAAGPIIDIGTHEPGRNGKPINGHAILPDSAAE